MTEYKVEKIARGTAPQEIQERLNGHGKDDWELVGIDPSIDGSGSVYIFRREKTDRKPVQGFAEAALNRSPKTENL